MEMNQHEYTTLPQTSQQICIHLPVLISSLIMLNQAE